MKSFATKPTDLKPKSSSALSSSQRSPQQSRPRDRGRRCNAGDREQPRHSPRRRDADITSGQALEKLCEVAVELHRAPRADAGGAARQRLVVRRAGGCASDRRRPTARAVHDVPLPERCVPERCATPDQPIAAGSISDRPRRTGRPRPGAADQGEQSRTRCVGICARACVVRTGTERGARGRPGPLYLGRRAEPAGLTADFRVCRSCLLGCSMTLSRSLGYPRKSASSPECQ